MKKLQNSFVKAVLDLSRTSLLNCLNAYLRGFSMRIYPVHYQAIGAAGFLSCRSVTSFLVLVNDKEEHTIMSNTQGQE